jgi:asparagine synthase (glutamine-hydrolysing)
MAASLARRGPDAQGIHVDGACGFAHARLSIIDIAGSPQPMAPPDSDLSLVFNGEVYNYKELREELRADGASFGTAGDTEVVLRLLERHGEAGLPRLDAMFAFAIWDRRSKTLLLARDAIGEKPLFYATPAPGLFVFGSEIKALLKHPAVDPALDEAALRQALRFRAVYGEATLYKGVRQLEPGCWLSLSRSGVRTGRFHDLTADVRCARQDQHGLSETALIEAGKSLFEQSVRERLVADVPVGAFLSGGLDSSLIVAAMRKLRAPGEEIRTFSVGFTGDPNSELGYAQTVAEALGTVHRPISVGPEAFVARLAELSACRDAPMSQPADVAIAEMSRLARQSVKVVLSGEGADEVFAGYPKYGMAKVPAPVRAAIRFTGPERVAALAGFAGLDRTRARVAARALARPTEVDRMTQWFSYWDRADLAGLLPSLGWSDADWAATLAPQAAAMAEAGEGGPLYRMQALDCRTWLPGNMLERGDRMTMAEGLEMRPPFLDKALVAWGLALPDRLKVRGGVGKLIVRRWAADLLPAQIVGRRKWGFRVPLGDWFRGPLRPLLNDYVGAQRGLCGQYGDRPAIARLLERHQSGAADLGETLWTLLVAEIWYQDVFTPRETRVFEVA